MNRLLIAFLLLFTVRLSAVEYVHFKYAVETNGCILRGTNATAPNLDATTAANTNLAFFNGFATNNTLTATNGITLIGTEMGFDTNATGVQRQWTNYGTKFVRRPYPLQTTNDIHPDAVTNSVPRIWTSTWFSRYASNITASIRNGAWASTNGAAFTNCMATNMTVINESIMEYPKVIANWSWPGWNRETNSTMRLRVVGFHGFSVGFGQPLACVKFIVRDQSGNNYTNIATKMTVDWPLFNSIFEYVFGLAFPFGEYISDIPLAGFVNLDQLRCDFLAYPWVGDTNAVFDTTRNIYTGITALPTSITNLCDRLMTYTDIIAVVDPGLGGAGARATNGSPTGVHSNLWFTTIGKALEQVCASNNVIWNHNDAGGATIHLTSNVVATLGASLTYGIPWQSKAWCVIKPYPGHAVNLTTQTSGQRMSNVVQFVNITFGGSAAFFSDENLGPWFNACTLTNTSVGIAQNCPVLWATGCRIPKLTQGLRANSIQNTSWNVRQCNLEEFATTIGIRTTIGNWHPNLRGSTYRVMSDYSSGQTAPLEYGICYNNGFFGMAEAQTMFTVGENLGITNGIAIVQNIFEGCTNTLGTFNQGKNTANDTNHIDWHNLRLGVRTAGSWYTDSGSVRYDKEYIFLMAGINDNSGFKADDYISSPNGARIGGWRLMNQVGCSGTLFVECNNAGSDAAGSFNPEFNGLNSYHPIGSGTNEVAFPRFIDRRSWGEPVTPARGGGNYRLQSISPAIRLPLPGDPVPFDLIGRPRTDANSAAGVFIFEAIPLTGNGPLTISGNATLQ